MNYIQEAKLKQNFLSLVRSVEKYQDSLSKIVAGKDLYEYVFANFYNTEYLATYNIRKLPIELGHNVPSFNYEMIFRADGPLEEAVAEASPVVGQRLVIVESAKHLQMKKELKKYIGEQGLCILHLKNQNQYVVQFDDGEAVAFPVVNVKVVDKLEMVTEVTVKEHYSNGRVTSLTTNSLAEDVEASIERNLRKKVGVIDAVEVIKRYFLAEI